MAPIYAVDSFLSILYPPAAIYINMLRDCYEVSHPFHPSSFSSCSRPHWETISTENTITDTNRLRSTCFFTHQAYVLYLFLSLMLAFLNSDEDDYEVTVYLETKLPYKSHKQYGKGSLSKGKAFLRYCKFGVLQVSLFFLCFSFVLLLN